MKTSSLTVLHISTELGWQGGEQQAFYLAEGLRQRGHRSVVMARRNGAFAKRMQANYFPVHTFRRRGRGPDSLWLLRRLVAKLRPNVVHAHDGHGLTAAGLATLGLGRKPLCVASRRVAFPIRSPAKFCHFADGVIGISTAVMEACRKAGISESKLQMVHSGIDRDRMRGGSRERGRKILGLQNNEKLLLTIASLTECKGHAHLLTGMPQIFERFPEAHLALVGQGELKPSLCDLVTDLGIANRVHFLGFRNDVSDLLCAADLFVMPSVEEGLCTSLLDAMGQGIPVVTTSAGGIKDAVGYDCEDGPYAYVVPPQNSQLLCDGIMAALSQPDKAKYLALQASKHLASNFTHCQMVEGTISAYRNWLMAPAKRSA